MRLKKVTTQTDPDTLALLIGLKFTVDGAMGSLLLTAPGNWAAMTRAEKVAWGKGEITSYLTTHTIGHPEIVIYPDETAPETAAGDFENLPGWATWTGAQADAWIEANVTDFASAKMVLRQMAKAIIYLRDMVLEK